MEIRKILINLKNKRRENKRHIKNNLINIIIREGVAPYLKMSLKKISDSFFAPHTTVQHSSVLLQAKQATAVVCVCTRAGKAALRGQER